MPNHCTNSLKIIGDKKIIKLCEKFMKSPKTTPRKQKSKLDFRQIVPIPSCVFLDNLGSEEQAASPNRNWYDWNREHWATKWNAYSVERHDLGVFTFETAWSPPLPVIKALSWLFPELTFDMNSEDEGGAFNTNFVFEKGELTSEQENG